MNTKTIKDIDKTVSEETGETRQREVTTGITSDNQPIKKTITERQIREYTSRKQQINSALYIKNNLRRWCQIESTLGGWTSDGERISPYTYRWEEI